MAINQQVNKYEHLDPSQYPAVKDQILERQDALKKAIEDVNAAFEDQISKLQDILNDIDKDLVFINTKLTS